VSVSVWVFGGFGLIALIVGLLLVIRPRQSGEVWRSLQQAVQPYWKINRAPVGVYIAVGCVCLAVAIPMLFTAWDILTT
jgi:hypothetical protein